MNSEASAMEFGCGVVVMLGGAMSVAGGGSLHEKIEADSGAKAAVREGRRRPDHLSLATPPPPPLLVIKVAAFSASARSRKNILAPPFTKVRHFGGSCLSKARNDINSLFSNVTSSARPADRERTKRESNEDVKKYIDICANIDNDSEQKMYMRTIPQWVSS